MVFIWHKHVMPDDRCSILTLIRERGKSDVQASPTRMG
jgi:hypothetical protein